MSALLLNSQPFHMTLDDLPCMIHGVEKSGASFFTMNVVLDLLEQGDKVIFYSAFQPARDFLTENVPAESLSLVTKQDQFDDDKQLLIPISGEKDLFMNLLRYKGDSDYIVVIKNIEELDQATVEEILSYKNIIVSGGCGDTKFSDMLMHHSYNAQIIFSDIEQFALAESVTLEKYQGYYIGKGTVSLKLDTL